MNDVVFSRSSLAAAELPLYEGIPLSRATRVDSPALAAKTIGFDTVSKPIFLKGVVAYRVRRGLSLSFWGAGNVRLICHCAQHRRRTPEWLGT